MDDLASPSGTQFEITHGEHRATIVSVGGGVRSYSVAGRAVVDGYAEDAICDGARGQTLVPWPNRVKDGQWSFDGGDLELSLTEPSQHNAIHGLVRWERWSSRRHDAGLVELECGSVAQPGYPWQLEVANRWELSDAGLAVTTTIVNRSRTAAPVAAGFHPYLTVGTTTIDSATLHLPADTRLPTGDQQIPTGLEPVAGTPYDFREPRRLGDIEIDYTFTDLHRDADGRCRLRLSAPDGDTAATLWVDEAYPYLEVFTGDALPDSGRRRQGLGVEPMSAPPNAMASGVSLVVLQPDEVWRGCWGIEPR
jgi:aldose 1-epimerase